MVYILIALSLNRPHAGGGEGDDAGGGEPLGRSDASMEVHIVPTQVGVNRIAHGGNPVLTWIVPTQVGVNRGQAAAIQDVVHRPHAGGGEPRVPKP